MKSKAVVFTEKGQVCYQDVDTPNPGPEDVVIRTKYSWISNGTEGSFLKCERVDGIQPWLPGMKKPYPMVPGYQKVGIVEGIGRNVKGYKEGQWVFATITKIPDVQLGFGGHIANGPSDSNEVLPLPDNLDPILFSGLVLTQVGYNTGSRGEAPVGSHVVVVGDGMVGQWTAQQFKARGFKVALLGRHDFRLSLFPAGHGDLIINTKTNPDWQQALQNWALDGIMIAADTVGNEVNYAMNEKLMQMLARGGHFITAGHNGTRSEMDLKLLIASEITLHCPCGWTRHRLAKTMQSIAQGDMNTLSLITHRMPAEQAAAAWKEIQENRDQTLGVVLEWR